MPTLPATRVLVSVTGTTYYLSANAFYRRVMNGAQETFVVVTAPAGVVFVAALPANFEVVQLNTMYFKAGGRYYVPYHSPDGADMYHWWTRRRRRPRQERSGLLRSPRRQRLRRILCLQSPRPRHQRPPLSVRW